MGGESNKKKRKLLKKSIKKRNKLLKTEIPETNVAETNSSESSASGTNSSESSASESSASESNSPIIATPKDLEKIDLRQIRLTERIRDAIKKDFPNVDLSKYKITTQNQGFQLARMDRMLELSKKRFNNLLRKEPIELKPLKRSDGKSPAVTIDNVLKPMYDIINGRHRVAYAVAHNYTTINAKII